MTRWRLLALSLMAGCLFAGLMAPTVGWAQDVGTESNEAVAAEELDEAAGDAEALAEDAAAAVDEAITTGEEAEEEGTPTDPFDNFVLFMCAVLVIFMQSGFAMVEAGFNSQKNVINILFKNLMDICVGVCLYAIIGFNLMYPGNWIVDGYLGEFAFLLGDEFTEDSAAGYGYHGQADFLFQVAFAATAATIVSGAVAGRMQFRAYLVYSALLTAIIYPISGSWKWGGGWLDAMGFYDFAGSCVVHAVGGFAGLAGAIVLGPRLGRYTPDGKSVPLPGHSIALATLGVFILWVGWYGFNPGSQLTFNSSGDASAVSRIAVNTTLSAAAGGVMAMIVSWGMFGKPDISMALNGVLGGLVGITANCDGVTNSSAVIIGLISGLLVVLGVLLLDKLKIDDPVGAWPVHGLCGIWGCLACAFFEFTAEGDTIGYWGATDDGADYGNVVAQVVGSIAIPAWGFVTMLILFLGLKAIGWLRVSKEEEEAGLDISEHGMSAYTTA